MLLEDVINLDKYMEILLSEESAVANIATFGASACTAFSSSASVGTVNPRMQARASSRAKGKVVNRVWALVRSRKQEM